MDASKLQQVIDWLIDGARSAQTPSQMMAECCERLVALGLPLWRVGVFVRTLHPEIFGRSFVWRQGAEVEIGSVDYSFQDLPMFRDSPLAIVVQQGVEFRANPQAPEAERFPILMDLRSEGVTDYVAMPLTFLDRELHASSWTTQAPGGFTDEQVQAIRSLIPVLSRYSEIIGLRRIASVLLDTYVGNRAGERILGGQIRRGHTDTMHAAIWLSDLRGFTPLSDRLPPEAVVEILNQYFDCQVAAIREQGGEVLKFMGDGLLAVFPIPEHDGDPAEVCSRVLRAARLSRANVEALQYPTGDTVERFRFGLALHVGQLLYGNIGGGDRLDFTCIGPAVNLAARLERIAARLKRTVVASEAFAGICREQWADLGEFPIAGLASTQRVFVLRDEAGERLRVTRWTRRLQCSVCTGTMRARLRFQPMSTKQGVDNRDKRAGAYDPVSKSGLPQRPQVHDLTTPHEQAQWGADVRAEPLPGTEPVLPDGLRQRHGPLNPRTGRRPDLQRDED